MTYFLKDCGREVSPPAKEREDIARAAAETFATRPYIRFALFIEPYADGSGDDSVELIAVPDRRFGVPLVPWAATGCEEFAYDLVAALGRDVDCCLDKCERARLSLIHRTLTPIYRRPDSAIEPADISGGDALEAACLANRFADKLLADGRPAFHIAAQRLR